MIFIIQAGELSIYQQLIYMYVFQPGPGAFGMAKIVAV
jgi:hypothetical protein